MKNLRTLLVELKQLPAEIGYVLAWTGNILAVLIVIGSAILYVGLKSGHAQRTSSCLFWAISGHLRHAATRLLDYVSNFLLWTDKYDLIFSNENLYAFTFGTFSTTRGGKSCNPISDGTLSPILISFLPRTCLTFMFLTFSLMT